MENKFKKITDENVDGLIAELRKRAENPQNKTINDTQKELVRGLQEEQIALLKIALLDDQIVENVGEYVAARSNLGKAISSLGVKDPATDSIVRVGNGLRITVGSKQEIKQEILSKRSSKVIAYNRALAARNKSEGTLLGSLKATYSEKEMEYAEQDLKDIATILRLMVEKGIIQRQLSPKPVRKRASLDFDVPALAGISLEVMSSAEGSELPERANRVNPNANTGIKPFTTPPTLAV